ncbi:MAG: MBL fold metallo-hydrolase [Candidatus Binatus sp.]|uniref:MBL fold metallo-hydrolase n=1 Tax=Candidatus Binatus sp. TaxID=2811406 RepID=UPI003D09CF01
MNSISFHPLRLMRSRPRAIAAVALISLALFAARSYPLDMNAAPANPHPRLEPASWPDDSLTITNLGHATLLMNFFGTRVLSDPTLFSRVGVSFDSILTIGPKRIVDPPLTPAQLQHIDIILITHAHMDHLDLPSLEALPKSAVVVACEKCAKLIAPLGFNDVRELKWGETTVVKGLTIRAMGARHWGRRWPPLGAGYGFNSYVLEKNGRRMLLACDSAQTDLFASLASTPPDVAAFSIGAYDPWIYNHANPEQVWAMFQQTRARYLIPIHWGTFRLSKEPMQEPLQRLIAAAGGQQDRIVIRQIGATWTLPASIEARQAAGR